MKAGQWKLWIVTALTALCCAAAPPAAAQDFTIDDVIDVWVDDPWPETLHRGWMPIFVELENTGERAVELVVELVTIYAHNGERRVRQRVRIEPGQRTRHELLAPLEQYESNTFYLQLRRGGRVTSRGPYGAEEAPDLRRHNVLVVSESPPPSGTAERWSETISNESIGGTRVQRFSTGRRVTMGSAPKESAPDNIRFALASHGQMPRSPAAYTSLALVVIDTRGNLPEAARLEPLLAWAFLGGHVAFLGPNAGAALAALPGVDAWLEPRFALETIRWSGVGGTVRGTQYGFGALWVGDADEPLETRSHEELVQHVCMGHRQQAFPHASGDRISDHWPEPEIPGLRELPYRGFSVLLLLFAIVIGPVNFTLVKRTGKPVWLLVTIPAIALLCSIALIAYGVFYQGIDVKSGTRVLTVLDQREHRAATVEQRLLFAGLSPGAGLRPQVNTVCFDLARDGEHNRSADLRVDQTNGPVLAGDFLPSRKPTLQQIVSEGAARERLLFTPTADGYRVENGFEARLFGLVLRDLDGVYFATEARLEPGESAELTEVGAAPDHPRLKAAVACARAGGANELTPGSFWTQTDRNTFGDKCEIEVDAETGTYDVLGILPANAEAWR